MNNWHEVAITTLERSLNPVATELNELDWKSNISDKSERLSPHFLAFANNAGGDFLVLGINNNGQFIQLSKDAFDNSKIRQYSSQQFGSTIEH